MQIAKKAAAAAAAAMLIGQPCLAADDMRNMGGGERRSGAFAGLNLRVPVGKGNPEKPSARMQLTTTHEYRNASGEVLRAYRADGLELGLRRTGAASLRIAGQDLRATKERLAMNGSTKTYLIVGGVVLVVVVLAAVVAAHSVPAVDFDDEDFN
jgi:hypothetical protein